MTRTTVLALALLAATATGAAAQSPAPGATPDTTTAGAFDRLSPGNQKIARAIYEAQQTGAPAPGDATPRGGTATAPKALTLDEIAARKQAGEGWGVIFKDLRTQGLVQDKNLGQAVSRANHRRATSTTGTVTTAGNRTTSASGTAARGRAWKHDEDGARAHDGGRDTRVTGGSGHGHGRVHAAGGGSPHGHGGGAGRGGGHGRTK
jgi:hypothetical protein